LFEPLQNRKYSLKWAEYIVSKLWESHRRATEYLETKYGMTAEKAAWLLANDQTRWCRYKKAVHIASKWFHSMEIAGKNEIVFSEQVEKAYLELLVRDNLIKTT